MSKYLYYILLFCCSFLAYAQGGTEFFLEKDTIFQQDTLKAEQIPAVNFKTADTVSYNQKDFEKGYQKKYSDSEFIYKVKSKPDTQWDRFLKWLGNFLRELFSFGNKTSNASWFVIIVRILLFAIVGYVIYLIVASLLGKDSLWLFRRSQKKVSVDDIIEQDITQMDFRQLIENTKKDGDYRLAVRYYYLWLLKTLTYREIIKWHPDKTNTDYLYEIKDSTLRKDFEYLSYVYDYSWYGDFHIDNEAYIKAEKAFQKTLNTL